MSWRYLERFSSKAYRADTILRRTDDRGKTIYLPTQKGDIIPQLQLENEAHDTVKCISLLVSSCPNRIIYDV